MLKTKKPKKNYIILGAIYIGIILLVLYFSKWYQTYQEYKKATPVIEGVLQEIKPTEVEHYIQEAPNALLYLCTAEEDVCRNFEREFKGYVKKHSLEDKITYLNLSQEEDANRYVDDFIEKYQETSFEIGSYPLLLQFEDGKIDKACFSLTIEKVEDFLKEE